MLVVLLLGDSHMRQMLLAHCRLHNGSHRFDGRGPLGDMAGVCCSSFATARWTFETWMGGARLGRLADQLERSRRIVGAPSAIWTDGLLWDLMYYQMFARDDDPVARALYATRPGAPPDPVAVHRVVREYAAGVARYVEELRRRAGDVPVTWLTTHAVSRSCAGRYVPRAPSDALAHARRRKANKTLPRLCRTFFWPEVIARMNREAVRAARSKGARVFHVQSALRGVAPREYLQVDGVHVRDVHADRVFLAALDAQETASRVRPPPPARLEAPRAPIRACPTCRAWPRA